MSTAILEIRAKIGSARLMLDRNQVPQLLDEERAAMSLAHCSAVVEAVKSAAPIDDADKATLRELAQQVQWEASDASTIARAFSGDNLLNALDERDREKPLQAKAERTPVKRLVKRPAKAERTPVKRPAKAERTPVKRPAKAKPCKPQKPPKMDTPEKQPKTEMPPKRPHFSLEQHRGQYMCRTGIAGPGSTYKISFGAGKQFKSQSEALQAAESWVRDQCALRGFD